MPPPARVLHLLDLFRLEVVQGESYPIPRDGREEAAFLKKVCHPPSPGSGRLLAYPACSPGALASSSPQAWESWARSGWDGAGRPLDYNGWEPPMFGLEPHLLALARHLTAAGSLMDIFLDTIRQIPTSWILEGGRFHEQDVEELEEWRQARRREEQEHKEEHEEEHEDEYEDEYELEYEDEYEEEHKEEALSWLQSLLYPFQQRNLKQPSKNDGTRTMAGLLNMTASLSELRSIALLDQEVVALEAVAGVVHLHRLRQDLGKELEKLMADGGGEGWWSSHPGGNTRRRIPSVHMMALIMRGLEEKVDTMGNISLDWHQTVKVADRRYYLQWFDYLVAEDERLSQIQKDEEDKED